MRLFSTPELITLSALLLLVIAALCARLIPRQNHPPLTLKYEAVPSLLTPAERSFFGVLQQAVEAEFQIFAKVRLADIVKPKTGLSRSGWQSAFNRTACKHVDFVLCDLSSLAVVGVIELDDKTHEQPERSVRDALIDSVLTTAQIPILRIQARQSYSPSQLRDLIKNLVSKGSAIQSGPIPT